MWPFDQCLVYIKWDNNLFDYISRILRIVIWTNTRQFYWQVHQIWFVCVCACVCEPFYSFQFDWLNTFLLWFNHQSTANTHNNKNKDTCKRFWFEQLQLHHITHPIEHGTFTISFINLTILKITFILIIISNFIQFSNGSSAFLFGQIGKIQSNGVNYTQETSSLTFK